MASEEPDEIVVEPGFYRRLEVDDEKILSNIETGIELYQGKHDRAGKADAAVNFERALGIFSISFVRMVQEIMRKKETDLSAEQKLLMDFGVLDSRLFKGGRVMDEIVAELAAKRTPGGFEIYYLDQWMEKIARGRIKPTSDAAQTKSKTKQQEVDDSREERRSKLESELDRLCREELEQYDELRILFGKYSPVMEQGDKISALLELKRLVQRQERIVKEETVRYAELDSIKTKQESESGEEGSLASERRTTKYSRMREEFDTLITVMRSCAVRGGLIKNTPILIDKWIPLDSRISINTYEFVESKLSEFEEMDPTIFKDRQGIRKSPMILILPGVGTGMAWKDRIMLSLFPPPTQQPDICILRTLAGYRWHIATSSFNWRHIPGEIGSMYQLIYPELTFNNLEKSFLDDYVNWITKEAQGFQVISSQVRHLFWKKMPFSTEHKQKLSKRATVYAKLYGEDLARGQ